MPAPKFPDAWSFSAIEMWEQCPAKYGYRRVQKLPEPQGPALDRGNRIHAEIANYLLERTHVMPEAVKAPAHQQLVNEIRAQQRECMIELQWGFSNRWITTGWNNYGVVWLRLKLDVGIIYGDGTAEVLDWKSGKAREESEDQMNMYATVMLQKFGDLRAVETRLVYLDAGVEAKPITYTRDGHAKRLDAWTQRANRMLSDRDFMPRPGRHCNYCHFSRSNGGPCRQG